MTTCAAQRPKTKVMPMALSCSTHTMWLPTNLGEPVLGGRGRRFKFAVHGARFAKNPVRQGTHRPADSVNPEGYRVRRHSQTNDFQFPDCKGMGTRPAKKKNTNDHSSSRIHKTASGCDNHQAGDRARNRKPKTAWLAAAIHTPPIAHTNERHPRGRQRFVVRRKHWQQCHRPPRRLPALKPYHPTHNIPQCRPMHNTHAVRRPSGSRPKKPRRLPKIKQSTSADHPGRHVAPLFPPAKSIARIFACSFPVPFIIPSLPQTMWRASGK